jgi:hypothetical protein
VIDDQTNTFYYESKLQCQALCFFKEGIYILERDCVGRRVVVKSKSTLNQAGLYPLLCLYGYKYNDHKNPVKTEV